MRTVISKWGGCEVTSKFGLEINCGGGGWWGLGGGPCFSPPSARSALQALFGFSPLATTCSAAASSSLTSP